MDVIDIRGIKFLRCEKIECLWNVGYTPCDFNREGLEFTFRHAVGTWVCNFGAKALAYGAYIHRDCPHKLDVCRLLGEKDLSFQCRFWGVADPEVARRALGVEPDGLNSPS